MDAKTFLQKTNRDDLEKVLKEAGTNLAYFRHIAYGHRKASGPLARKLHEASGGLLGLHDLRPDIFPKSEAA